MTTHEITLKDLKDLKVLQSTYKYLSTCKYIPQYLSTSTSTTQKLKKDLSTSTSTFIDVLIVLKYKYQCTWPHACYTHEVIL